MTDDELRSRVAGLMSRVRRFRDLAMAIAAGAGMTAISYAVMTRQQTDTIADYFLEKAYSEGGGRNVVNVILVDFRGFDTLGEITVLGIVGLTVYALLRRFRPPREVIGQTPQQRIVTAGEQSDLLDRPDTSDAARSLP